MRASHTEESSSRRRGSSDVRDVPSEYASPARSVHNDMLKRIWELNQKLDSIDGHFKILSSASAASMMKLDKKLDDLSFRLRLLSAQSSGHHNGAWGGRPKGVDSDDHHVATESENWNGNHFAENGVSHYHDSVSLTAAALRCNDARYEVSRTFQTNPYANGSLPPISDRSDASLPLPIGDLLAVDAPIWDTVKPTSPPVTIPHPEVSFPMEEQDEELDESNDDEFRPHVSWGYTSKAKRSSFQSLNDLKVKADANMSLLGRLWNFLDEPDSGPRAKAWATFAPYLIAVSVLLAVLQTATPPLLQGAEATLVNVLFETVFLGELILRAISCPQKKLFIFDYNNTIDFLVVVPLFIRLVSGFRDMEGEICGELCVALMCVTPLLRSLKTLRRFETLPLLIDAFEKAGEGLPVCLFVLFVLILFFGPLLYLVEPRSNIDTVGTAMWLTIVTMTTVGYGDITPKTTIGSLIVSALVILSVLYMAMPLGIVGNAFTEVWQDRDFILLRHRVKIKFKFWGYKAHDVPALFSLFAEDGSGELTLDEFTTMLTEMRIGLKEKRIVQLFEALDEDQGGSVDDREFVKKVFPDDFHLLYERRCTTREFSASPSKAELDAANIVEGMDPSVPSPCENNL